MDYDKIKDRVSGQRKRWIAETYKVPYKTIRKKVFDILNSHKVSEQTIEELMNYIDTWYDIYDEKENIIEYLRKNMPKEQPKTRQGWEAALPAMLDY